MGESINELFERIAYGIFIIVVKSLYFLYPEEVRNEENFPSLGSILESCGGLASDMYKINNILNIVKNDVQKIKEMKKYEKTELHNSIKNIFKDLLKDLKNKFKAVDKVINILSLRSNHDYININDILNKEPLEQLNYVLESWKIINFLMKIILNEAKDEDEDKDKDNVNKTNVNEKTNVIELARIFRLVNNKIFENLCYEIIKKLIMTEKSKNGFDLYFTIIEFHLKNDEFNDFLIDFSK